MAIKAKELRYAIDLSSAGELTEESGVALEVPPEWSPEHLLLAALAHCSLKSLRYHAARQGVEVRSASGSARALVTKRETDERYSIVESALELAVELVPEPDSEALAQLLALGERDCFIGSSLTAKPSYHWTVGGRRIDS